MSKVVVSDTTTLIVLERLAALPLLCRLFEQVLIPQTVFVELKYGSDCIQPLLEKAACFNIIAVQLSSRLENLNLLLDPGEAAAIELALIRQLPLVIDEKKGRTLARQLGLNITGFSGILILAVRKQMLSPSAAIGLLEQALENGFRLSEQLYQQVSKEINA